MRITRDEYHGRTKITKKEKKEPIKEAPAESPAPLEAPTSAEAPLSSSTNLSQPNKNKVDLSVKLSDAEIKKQLKAAEESSVARLGTIGAELINSSTKTTEALVAEGKALRKQAQDQLNKARNIHNAQQHMLNTGDSLPLAFYLGYIPLDETKLVEKHIEQAGIKDYFGEKNPKKASD